MKKLLTYLFTGAIGLSVASCSDWTEPEAVDSKYGTVEESANYPAYLESLRKYRNSEHTLVYAWVNLTANGPANQSERVTSLPDSIDVLVLSATNEIHPIVANDLQKVREQKGMKVMFLVDFDALKSEHNSLCNELGGQREMLIAEYEAREDYNDPSVQEELAQLLAGLANPTLEDYVLENLTAKLTYAKSMKVDGAMFAFDGKLTNYMTPDEKKAYEAQKFLFLGAASDWHRRNPGMIFDYMGKPQNLVGTPYIDEFNMLFMRDGLSASSTNNFSFILTQASTDGVPADRLGMMTTFESADPDDTTTGFFSDGSYAINGLTKWVKTNNVAAVGVQNVQFDYFSSLFSYPHVRALIQAANPK